MLLLIKTRHECLTIPFLSMYSKKQAIEFAKQFNWTAKDAERAFAGLNPSQADEQVLLMALVKFAGSELLERQRLQAAQKAQVTKKKNEIKKIELDFQQKIEEGEQKLKELRSTFIPVIATLYRLVKPFGLQDPWIEAILETYQEYQNTENYSQSEEDQQDYEIGA